MTFHKKQFIIIYVNIIQRSDCMIILNFIRGIFMAIADSVPGVSGGTVAFILGFYDKFISSLDTITSNKKGKKEKKEALLFLIKIGIGWIFGFALSVLFISSIFESQIYKISSLFVGFIIFSLPLIIIEEKKSIINKYKNIVWTIVGLALVILITYFNPVSSSNSSSLSLSNPNIMLYAYVFICGIIAISAMILPGISGSTLLLIFGLYVPLMSAIKEVLHFNFSYLPIVMIFGCGVIIGVLSIIKLIKKLLLNKRSQLIYFILGLMIGSIYAIFMGPTTLEVAKPAMSFSTFNIIFFLTGGFIILLLQKIKILFEKKSLKNAEAINYQPSSIN